MVYALNERGAHAQFEFAGLACRAFLLPSGHCVSVELDCGRSAGLDLWIRKTSLLIASNAYATEDGLSSSGGKWFFSRRYGVDQAADWAHRLTQQATLARFLSR